MTSIYGHWLLTIKDGQQLYTHRTEDKTVLYEQGKCLVNVRGHESIIPCDPSDFENLQTILLHAEEA